jgi:di/tricarboxylate transporter
LPLLKEIVYGLLNEIKAIVREYLHEQEAALKKRLRKLLITSIIISILVSLVISFIGSASLFILIGSLKYLMTFMPAWKAWFITGITAGIIGALLFLALFIIIRKQLKTSKENEGNSSDSSKTNKL